MYLGLVWDTCEIHAKCQDTCILLDCNRTCKIHIEIHQDTFGIHVSFRIHTGYMQDASGYIRIRIV
jgi:hypothetical protein